jgi:hypothetical protein
MITAHCADHHTAYGSLVAGAQEMSYLTLRPPAEMLRRLGRADPLVQPRGLPAQPNG